MESLITFLFYLVVGFILAFFTLFAFGLALGITRAIHRRKFNVLSGYGFVPQPKEQDAWIDLHVEKVGYTYYFYEGDEFQAKFLFQCRTHQEMVDNIERIRGDRGVRMAESYVKMLEQNDFFIQS